jgi:hypothetical protein
MMFGETLLEFSKETFFYNVLDGFFFCIAFTRGVFTNVPVKQHIIAFAMTGSKAIIKMNKSVGERLYLFYVYTDKYILVFIYSGPSTRASVRAKSCGYHNGNSTSAPLVGSRLSFPRG